MTTQHLIFRIRGAQSKKEGKIVPLVGGRLLVFGLATPPTASFFRISNFKRFSFT